MIHTHTAATAHHCSLPIIHVLLRIGTSFVASVIFDQNMSELVAEVESMKVDDSLKVASEKLVKPSNTEGDDECDDDDDDDEEEGAEGGGDKKKKKKKKKSKKKKAGGARAGASEPCQPQVHRLLTGDKHPEWHALSMF